MKIIYNEIFQISNDTKLLFKKILGKEDCHLIIFLLNIDIPRTAFVQKYCTNFSVNFRP